jgi:hypothetical protein
MLNKINSKHIGLVAGLLLIIACYMPWVLIHSRDLVITGMQAAGTSYGKPGLLHLILLVFYFPFTLTNKLWAKRMNLLVVALNLSWMLRNFLIIGICRGGECPDKQVGFYLVSVACFLMLLTALFPSVSKK